MMQFASRSQIFQSDGDAAGICKLPPGKDFHYFLSHKKRHTLHGQVPAQIARNIHDSLELLGYKGWFDADRLSKISQEELRLAIGKCAAMVVVLHDETHLSEWCDYEWKQAAAAELPVKVVIDMERCSKQQALQAIGAAHPNLMAYQWSELTERHRRECLSELCSFFEEGAVAKAGNTVEEDICRTSLRIGANGMQVTHDIFEALLLFGGVPCHTPSLFWSRAWVFFVLYGRAVCLAMCIIRLIYAHGPSFTDHQSCLAVVMLHAYVFYSPYRLNRALRSEAIRKMSAMLEGGTAADLSDRLHRHTRWVAIGIFAIVAVAATVAYVAYLPLFFHPAYIGPQSRPWDRAFGWVSGLVFIFLIPSIFASFLASFAVMYLLLSLGTAQIEVAIDQIHPTVAELGIHRYSAIAHAETLSLTNASLSKFRLCWNIGVKHFQVIRCEIAPAQALGLLSAIVGLTTPLGLFLHGFVFDKSVHWAHVVRLFALWFLAGALQALGIFLPALYSTEAMRNLRRAVLHLGPDSPLHCLFITQVCYSSPLTCYVAWVLPATRSTVLLLALLIGASFVPALHLDCYGHRLVDAFLMATPRDKSDVSKIDADADREDAHFVRLAGAAVAMTLLLVIYSCSLAKQFVAERTVAPPSLEGGHASVAEAQTLFGAPIAEPPDPAEVASVVVSDPEVVLCDRFEAV